MEKVSDSSGTPSNNWRGTSIKDITNGKGPWSFAVTPLAPSRYHFVLYEMPATLQGPPKPRQTRECHLWDEDHVRMPFSEKNLFSIKENNSDVIKERWKIICEALSEPIKNSDEFEAAVNKYNSSLPKLQALQYFLNQELDKEESELFFSNLLPKIIDLALRLPELLPNGIPLLQQSHNRSLSISQLQIACLLANAFLCTFPWKKGVAATYPGVNFVSLFSAFTREDRRQCVCEKLKCICNYFRKVTRTAPVGVLTFERKVIPRNGMPRWDTLNNNLGKTRIHITSEGTIEDNGLGFLQVDFANKNIGGGVLRYGCVQEEIRFVLCPELIVSRLFIEQLGNGEAVIITGAERYNDYAGYGDTFEWIGDHQDTTPFDAYGRRKTTICVIDATRFTRSQEQFRSSLILRELNKAYVGFSTREKGHLAPIATGNWGCGAFNGSKHLKALIQLIACSTAGRDLVYYSFGDKGLMEDFFNMHSFLDKNQVTIVQLWRFLAQFVVKHSDEAKLYPFIQQAHFESKSQPTISHYFESAKDPSKINSASTSQMNQNSTKTNPENGLEIVIDETPPLSPQSSVSSSSEDILASSQSEFRPLQFVKSTKSRKSTENILNKLPKTDVSEIFDLLDGNGNTQPATNPPKEDALSIIDQYVAVQLNSKKSLEDSKAMDVDIIPDSPVNRGKCKITHYFAKIRK